MKPPDPRRSTIFARRTQHTGAHASAAESVTPPEFGDLIDGKYRVVEKLGEGAMGTVLRARDERLERDVAVKLIRPEWAKNPTFQQNFLAEARAMARVKHPHVVDVYDFGWSEAGLPFIAMEFVEGIDLESWIDKRENPDLSVDEALGFLGQICKGVAAIHEAGAVHRDLKPANMLVTGNLELKVSDLGLAQLSAAESNDGAMVGSPGFIAPEVIRRDMVPHEHQARADIYALGAIAYELLTGMPAFVGETAIEIITNQQLTNPMPPSLQRPELTEAFDSVIQAAMASQPLTRIDSAQAFRRALKDARARAMDPSIGRRVVIVDRDEAVRAAVVEAIQQSMPGVAVVEMGDAESALEAINDRPTSLVVTEMDLSGLHGEEFVGLLRTQTQLNHIPIVVLTGSGGAREWKRLRDLGADSFLLKPFDPIPFVALIRSLLDSPMRLRAAR